MLETGVGEVVVELPLMLLPSVEDDGEDGRFASGTCNVTGDDGDELELPAAVSGDLLSWVSLARGSTVLLFRVSPSEEDSSSSTGSQSYLQIGHKQDFLVSQTSTIG